MVDGLGLEIWVLGLEYSKSVAEVFPAWLPEQDRLEVDRIVVGAERHRKAAGRALVRHVLSQRTRIAPLDLAFEKNDFGKPILVGGAIHHSLSHSGDWIYLAVDTKPVGIDVEEHRELPELEGMMKLVFSDAERKWVMQGGGAHDRFFQVWTAKEALLKMVGKGFGESPIGVCSRSEFYCNSWVQLPAPDGYGASVAGAGVTSQGYGRIRQVVPRIENGILSGFESLGVKFPEACGGVVHLTGESNLQAF